MPNLHPQSPEDAAFLPPIAYDSMMEFRSVPLRDAYRHWLKARHGRLMPRTSDLRLNPGQSFFDYAALITLTPDPDYFVVSHGKKIEETFGSRAGRMLCDGLPEEVAARWRSGFDMVHHSGKPIKATSHLAFEGKTQIETENLIAPLGEDDTPSAFLLVLAVTNRTSTGQL